MHVTMTPDMIRNIKDNEYNIIILLFRLRKKTFFLSCVIRKLCSLLAYIKTNPDEEFNLLRRNFAALNLSYKVKFLKILLPNYQNGKIDTHNCFSGIKAIKHFCQ